MAIAPSRPQPDEPGMVFVWPQPTKQCDVFCGQWQDFSLDDGEALVDFSNRPFELVELAVEEFSLGAPRSWTVFAVKGRFEPVGGWEKLMEHIPWPNEDEITYEDDVCYALMMLPDYPEGMMFPFAAHHRDNKRPRRSKLPNLVGASG